jgi:hypothetical protein
MVHILNALDKLLAAAPRLISDSGSPRQCELAVRSNRWSEALHAIYDEVLNEPIPHRLAEMVRRRERSRKS